VCYLICSEKCADVGGRQLIHVYAENSIEWVVLLPFPFKHMLIHFLICRICPSLVESTDKF